MNIPGDFLDVMQLHPIFPSKICHLMRGLLLVLPKYGTKQTLCNAVFPVYKEYCVLILPQCFHILKRDQILSFHLSQNVRQPNEENISTYRCILVYITGKQNKHKVNEFNSIPNENKDCIKKLQNTQLPNESLDKVLVSSHSSVKRKQKFQDKKNL